MDWPWYAFIPILGVIAWAAVAITAVVSRHRRGNPDAVIARLDAIDARLATVEKTLNDIP
ncbi:MAG: hypothetical protein ABIR17_12705 [Pseudolysinimonas sp.]|uniref:hypothetical protein n=1 Tax=Pseudolysinimonas sp. TaxID=2680009 RepID=UPI0032644163